MSTGKMATGTAVPMQWRKLVSAAEAACVEDKESGAGGGKGTVHGAPGEQWSVSGREGGATRQWCRLPEQTHHAYTEIREWAGFVWALF